MTLGGAAAAQVRFIVWCLLFGEPYGFAGCQACRHQVELDPADTPDTPVPDWRKRLVCSPLREPRYRYGCDRRATLKRKKPRWGKPGFRKWTIEGVGDTSGDRPNRPTSSGALRFRNIDQNCGGLPHPRNRSNLTHVEYMGYWGLGPGWTTQSGAVRTITGRRPQKSGKSRGEPVPSK